MHIAVRLKSALECIMLGLEKGAHVTIEVEGPDEAQFAEELVTLFERQFDFSA
jgi:phosphotransferase system HPr (HPr) family protein